MKNWEQQLFRCPNGCPLDGQPIESRVILDAGRVVGETSRNPLDVAICRGFGQTPWAIAGRKCELD